MAEEKQQPTTCTEEPKIPTDDKTSTCPVPNPPEFKTWPELVGLPAEEAVKKIKEDIPGIRVLMVPPNVPTRDFDRNRVFLYVDREGKVRSVPGIG